MPEDVTNEEYTSSVYTPLSTEWKGRLACKHFCIKWQLEFHVSCTATSLLSGCTMHIHVSNPLL